MKNKFEAINKEAMIGNKPKIMFINPPLPKKDKNGKYIITAKLDSASKIKKRKCSGCSRKRKSG